MCVLWVLGAYGSATADDFGKPPSGLVRILYNDHTVYAKPDTLKQRRVVAAFIRGHQIFVPLRSMFEQMGAAVRASADGKAFTATKPGTTISVRLGSHVVTINGEARPLDVAPMLYNGVVLIPVRVISEALGAYVFWVPDKRVVVVRYMPSPAATPAPAPAPTASAPVAPAPTVTPTAAPIREKPYSAFLAAGFTGGNTHNEFAGGRWCPDNSVVASAAYIFRRLPLAVKVDFRQDPFVTSINLQDAFGAYLTQFSTIDGGTATTSVSLEKQNTLDGRLEFKLADTGVGFGFEKLPDLNWRLSAFGSFFFYPSASGNYTVADTASPNNNVTYKQAYAISKYDVGLAATVKNLPIYLYGGFSGDRYNKRQNAPIDQTHSGPYVGLGLKQ